MTDNNVRINKFEEICVDFGMRHSIHDMPREMIFRNRKCYAAYFILAVTEMLKYAVKEDYESARTEINLIPITLEYVKKETSKKKKKKKGVDLKKRQEMQHYEDSSASEEDEEQKEESALMKSDLLEDQFFLRFKEALPALVKKDLMIDDLWLLFKRPLVTSQNLTDIPDMVLAKSAWHHNAKQSKMKVTILGKRDDLKFAAGQYQYAYKSVNLSGYQTLIENLIEFREIRNPYVDSILNISNSKSKFKIIRECDPDLVEQIRVMTCKHFKLNIDQEIVLNEVTGWFLPSKDKSAEKL